MGGSGLDYVAQEFLAGLGLLHDLPGALELLGKASTLRGFITLLLALLHRFLRLGGGVPEPLGDVELTGKLKSNRKMWR